MRDWLSSILVVSMLACASPAEAQWRNERPYRGLFASGTGDAQQLLTATASLGAGWDDNLVADAFGRQTVSRDLSHQFKGGVGTGAAALRYTLSRANVGFGATAGTTTRYYPSFENEFIRREYASVGGSANLGYGVSTYAGASYQPYSLTSLYPAVFETRISDPLVVDEDFPASLEHFFGYSAGLSYSRRLARRTTFAAGYGYGGRSSSVHVGRYSSHSADAGITHSISQNLALTAGYGYMEGHYSDNDRRYVNHAIDAGINYTNSLSFSRRTTLSVGTGTSAYRSARNDSLRYRATGSARLNHELGRTWNAGISYHRGIRFSESWPEPIFSDSVSAGVGGLVNRRTTLQFSARAMRGDGLAIQSGNDMFAYGAGAVLSVAVTRYINSGVSYAWYQHEFRNGLLLAPGLPDDFERHSVRAFVSVWAPLFQRPRRN